MVTVNVLRKILPVFLLFAFFITEAHAEISNSGVLDSVLDRYLGAAKDWGETITKHASWLFWTLATISLVWTFGMMALRKAEIGEFFAELARFLIFTGFFFWLLTNGPYIAKTIIESMQQIGSEAVGLNTSLSPSGIVDIGFEIFFKVLDNLSPWKPVDSTIGALIGAAILLILALIGINMLLLLVSAWILAYAGIFFLGFGGCNWTSDMSINYFKTVLGVATQIFVMILLVGIGSSFLDDYYSRMNEGLSLKDMTVLMIVALVLLGLVNKVPSMVSGIITGASVGGGGGGIGGFGVGALVGAAGMAAAVTSTGGGAMMGGLSNIAGGAQAITAAISKAGETLSGGTGGVGFGGNDSSSSGVGGASGNSNSPLASAMDDGSSSSVSSGSSSGGFGSKLSTATKFAGEVGKNLAKGVGDVAKGKVDSMVNAGSDRIGSTFGGKIAESIKNAGQSQPSFGEDSLSGSKSKG